MDSSAPLLEPEALEALRRTRPWLILISTISVIGCALTVIFLIAGAVGAGDNPERAHAMVAAAIGALAAAVERACRSQRNLWIVTAVVVGLSALFGLFQTLNQFIF